MTFANAFAAQPTAGVVYASATPLTTTETDLFNQANPPTNDPIVLTYNQFIVAEVLLSLNNGTGSNATYVVMQGDLGDGNWFDLAWCVWTGTSGSVRFLLCNGVPVGNAIQQTRTAGTSPGSNGSVQVVLPPRIRFVGKATVGGGSSSLGAGNPTPVVSATIRYHLTPVA